jgi:transposase
VRLSIRGVSSYLGPGQAGEPAWPLPEDLSDAQLERLLYPPRPYVARQQRPVPDSAAVHRELRRPNVTLSLLWEEYRAGLVGRDGFGYFWVLRPLPRMRRAAEADAALSARKRGKTFFAEKL